MGKATLAPYAVNYLATLWGTSNPGLAVFNGNATEEITGNTVMVGFNDEPTVPVLVGSQTPSSVGNHFADDLVVIQSQLVIVWGDLNDPPGALAQAATQLDLMFDAVRADPQLGGLVEQPGFAFPSTYTFRRAESDTGLVVIVDFTIQITVQIWDYQ